MNKYKLLLLDVDGTVVASKPDAVPSENVRRAVRLAQEMGIHVALVTGRAIYLTKDVIDALSLKGPSVFNGGPVIIDVTNGQVLHREVIPIGSLRELVTLAMPFGYPVYTDTDEYSNQITSPSDINTEAEQFFYRSRPNYRRYTYD